ncbi:phosphopyruvate hydratase, partial [Candidatus Woesearchaeota archaeon]|nr:phosphopyruvate hydratase [Candidatus Woesearchaeota archaeon]
MSEITEIKAREVLDSRGNPTVEVDLYTADFMTRAIVPSGASTGKHEAVELRDGGKRYGGKGVQKAIENIMERIAPKLIGLDVKQQQFIDVMMTRIDGTPNKEKLGANAILAVSMAVCRAGAMAKHTSLHVHIKELAQADMRMPKPFFNVINGGKHAGNLLDIQEYMIAPEADSFKEALKMGAETYHALKGIIKKKYGVDAVNVGDEGGFAPPLKNNEEPLLLLEEAIREAGYKGRIKIAMDCAASEFYHAGKYVMGSKGPESKQTKLSGEELASFYLKLMNKYPIISMEDPFAEDDWESWQYLMKKAENVQIVGDDL